MAKNEIKIKLSIDDQGNLKVIAKDAQKASQATDSLTQSTDRAGQAKNRYNKQEKGAGQLTNNSTKAFAKQAQTVGTATTFLSAYATVAANAFAITAAFGVLKRAAGVELLAEGLEFTGRAAGTNLPLVAEGLEKITGSAITAASAMKAVAVGTSAGFSTMQLEGLTKVASGASKALGRDMTDALDRLVRGAAKLEPEILDELGIMVRLDDVTKQYADSVGKTTGEVTAFEKRMAFTNAIIEQGTEKFGSLGEAVDANPYDKLGASFDKLVKTLLNIANAVVVPGIEILSNNMVALGAAVAFMINKAGAGLLAGALQSSAAAAAETASAFESTDKGFRKNIGSIKLLDSKSKELQARIVEGTASQKDYDAMLTRTNKAIKGVGGALKVLQKTSEKDLTEMLTGKLQVNKQARKELIKGIHQQTLATRQQAFADALGEAQAGNLRQALKTLGAGYKAQQAQQKVLVASSNGVAASFYRINLAARTAAGGLVVLGAGFLKALPYIGLIVMAGQLLFSAFKKVKELLTGPVFEPMTVSAEKNVKLLEEMGKVTEQYIATAERMESATRKNAAAFALMAGTTDSLASGLANIEQDKRTAKLEEFKKLQEEIAERQEKYNKAVKRGATIVATGELGRLRAAEEALSKAREDSTKVEAAAAKSAEEFASAAIANIDKRLELINKESLAYKVQIKQKEILEKLGSSSDAQGRSDAILALEKNRQNLLKIGEAEKAAGDLARAVGAEKTKMLKKQESAYTPLLTALKTEAKSRATAISAAKAEGAEAKHLIALKAKLYAIEVPENLQEASEQEINNYLKEQVALREKTASSALSNLETSIKEEAAQKAKVVGLKGQVALAKKYNSSTVAGYTELLALEEQLTSAKISSLKASIKSAESVEGEEGTSANLLKLKQDLAVAEKEKAAQAQNSLRIAVKAEELGLKELQRAHKLQTMLASVASQKAANLALDTETVSINREIARIKDPAAQGAKSDAQFEYDQAIAAAEAQKEAAIESSRIANLTIESQYALLEAQMKLEKEKLKLAQGGSLTAEQAGIFSGIEGAIQDGKAAAQANIRAKEENTIAKANLTIAKAQETLETKQLDTQQAIIQNAQALMTAQSQASATGKADLAIMKEKLEIQRLQLENRKLTNSEEDKITKRANEQLIAQAKSRIGAAEGQQFAAALGPDSAIGQAYGESSAIAARQASEPQAFEIRNAAATAQFGEGAELETEAKGSEKIAALAEQASPFLEQMKQLGPEGELTSAILGGALSIGESFSAAFEEIGNGGLTMETGVAAAQTAISAFQSMSAAKAKSQVANIDKEIAAEKKRDGKSKESLAKIAALEKKKESIKKKAFEKEKKAKLAGVVISTAAAIAKESEKGFPAAIPGIAFATALGAAQLAAISSSSYESGGSGASAGASAPPAEVSVGKRSNAVDLATSKGAAGELAFLRGESGIGNASNFKSAFTGARYRASGGSVGFIVGEQGPELFMPDSAGQVVSAGDTEEALENPGLGANVTFNINAIDTTNMEEMLTDQRENIVKMIRDVANSQGSSFLEGVDVGN